MDTNNSNDVEDEMRVSNTLAQIAKYGLGGVAFVNLLDLCYAELGYDLDDFLFEIWKETLND
jgi:hypothetical protein